MGANPHPSGNSAILPFEIVMANASLLGCSLKIGAFDEAFHIAANFFKCSSCGLIEFANEMHEISI